MVVSSWFVTKTELGLSTRIQGCEQELKTWKISLYLQVPPEVNTPRDLVRKPCVFSQFTEIRHKNLVYVIMPGHIFWKATEKCCNLLEYLYFSAHRFEPATYGILNDTALFICKKK